MSDRQTLLLVLVLLGLAECLFWVHRGAVVFRTWLGRRWQFVADGEVARNDRGGLHWAWPLPPFGHVHVCRASPFSYGPSGVLMFTAESLHASGRPPQSGLFLRWEDIEAAEAHDKKLQINGETVWSSDTVHTPTRLARWLVAIARLKPDQRPAKLREAVHAQFDRGAFAAKLEGLKTQTSGLDRLCQAFFVYLFVAVPWVVYRFGWLPALWYLLPVLYAQSVVIAVVFARLHRRFFPHAGDDRFKLSLIYALAPASTARARDPLSRGIVEEFHPLCGAATLLAPAEFAAVARRAWRDLHFPRIPESPSSDAAALETERWFRKECIGAFQTLLAAENLDPRDWTAPPKPTEAVHTQYCPRCEAQFTKEASRCQECGGRALLNLASR